jgi:hypothetical protein
MAKKKDLVSIWNVIERNDQGETKVLTVKNGRNKTHIVVYTSPIGVSTSAIVSGEITFPVGEIIEIPASDFELK